MPMMEPASPSEGYAMMREAFSISEQFNTAVIIRETRTFTQQMESIPVSDEPYKEVNLGLSREPWRFVPVPKNAVEKHRDLHQRIDALSEWANSTQFNRMTGTGVKGVVSIGFAHSKLLDVVGDENSGEIRLLKLGVLYPLPRKIIAEFLHDCDEALVVEEIEPFLETHIKAVAHDIGCHTKILGKQSNHLSREGELFRWQIQLALTEFIPEFVPWREYLKEKEAEEKPEKENYCADYQYDKILDELEAAAESLGGQKPVLIGDPGCLVTVADRLDAKYALGSAVSTADGLSKAGVDERAVALFGDSSFFHTTLPALCNAVYNQSKILMVVLDNKTTAASGFQANPGVGRDAMGREVPALDIEKIARACGVKHVYTSGPDDLDSVLREKFREGLRKKELALIIIQLEK
jgi:indolepyruvate ferredoxin oxidoreductase alpha subunit